MKKVMVSIRREKNFVRVFFLVFDFWLRVMSKKSQIKVSIITPAFEMSGKCSRAEVLAECERKLGGTSAKKKVELVQLHSLQRNKLYKRRYGCIVHRSGFSMDMVAKLFRQNQTLVQQLENSADALITFDSQLDAHRAMVDKLCALVNDLERRNVELSAQNKQNDECRNEKDEQDDEQDNDDDEPCCTCHLKKMSDSQKRKKSHVRRSNASDKAALDIESSENDDDGDDDDVEEESSVDTARTTDGDDDSVDTARTTDVERSLSDDDESSSAGEEESARRPSASIVVSSATTASTKEDANYWKSKFHIEEERVAELVAQVTRLRGQLAQTRALLQPDDVAADAMQIPLMRSPRAPAAGAATQPMTAEEDRMGCRASGCSCRHFRARSSAHWVCSGCGHLLLAHSRTAGQQQLDASATTSHGHDDQNMPPSLAGAVAPSLSCSSSSSSDDDQFE
jgi:hypothetical protein